MSYDFDMLLRIEQLFPELREAEKKVAQAIQKDLPFCAQASIGDLAERVGVSEATITRFAKAVGCKNVRELKLKLAQSLAIGSRFISSPIQSGTKGVFDAIRDVIDRHEERVDELSVQQIGSMICRGNSTTIFGTGGGSSMLAAEGYNRLFRLGIRCTWQSDSLMARMVASTLKASDVLLLISLTGRTPEVLEIANIAKQYGAQIAAITQYDSPLADIADASLLIETYEGDDIFRPTASRYALMVMMDLLAMNVAQQQEEETRENLRRIKLNLDTHRGGSGRQPLGD